MTTTRDAATHEAPLAREDRRGFAVSPQMTLLFAFGVVSVLNYLFSLVAARLLSPGDFGLLGFAQTLLLLCGLVLQSGIPWGLTRASIGSAPERRAALVRGALVVNLAVAAALGATIVGLFALGPLEAGLERWGVTLLLCAALGPIAAAAVARAVAQGIERFGVNAAIQALEVAGKAGVGLALAAVGFGVLGAVAGFVVGALLATSLGIWFLGRTDSLRSRGGIAWPSTADTTAMFGALLGMAVVLNQDLLAMKVLAADRAETGYYQAAIILANAPYFLVASAFVPVLFTKLARQPALATSAGTTGRTLAATAIFIVPLEVGLAVAPATALRLCFPDAYALAAPELRLLAIGNIVIIVVVLLSTAFQAVGRAGVPARTLLAVAVVEAVALALVVPGRSGVGASATFLAAACGAATVLGVVYLRGMSSADRRIAGRWAGRFGLAATLAVACAAAGAEVGRLPLGVACAVVVYAAALHRLGLLQDAYRTIVGNDPSGPTLPNP